MAAITTAAVGVASAGYQIYEGAKQNKEARKGIKDHKPLDTPNNHENIAVSTYGSDLMREETGRLSASSVEAARGAGSRGIFSSLPSIQEATNKANREIQVDLDQQVQKRDYAIAGENERIRGMLESRDQNKLAGLGTLLNAGQHNTMSGIRGAGNAMSYGMREIEAERKGKDFDYDQAEKERQRLEAITTRWT